ncbi:substrate-binding domain-containing protein [Coraliomargarita algicola]|uniref:Substrate-binding domain-containing protein n=1 Tax=Coraliomargarita algicola TaxID=3092156 RepID=A0ABZ0RMT9_9BACT|nr:substrate-binding domain-containing protein [Coraliomargarita sp. J2-16]WPJ96721.1 substrate-binding domain-containing protein [Coraliomargarita sp. J2-16]
MEPKPPAQRLKVIEALSLEMKKAKYVAGEVLPSEAALQQRLGVSRGTIRQALAELENRDLIYRIKGKGTFVRTRAESRPKPVVFLIREPWKVSHFHNAELLRGMQVAAAAAGANVIISSQTPGEWSAEFCNSIAGVMVLPRLLVDSDLLVLRQRAVPYCMAMESDLTGPSVVDHIEEAAYALADGLLQLGHRRIALLSGHFEHSDRYKKRGIGGALLKAGIDFKSCPDYCTNYDAGLAYEISQDILRSGNRPTAIIGFDNVLAIQAIRAAKNLGLHLPQDLSVVGFGGRDFGELMEPSLSTVNLRGEEAGRRVVEAMLGSNLSKMGKIEVGYDIAWRESSGVMASL